jgi:hypothetical protein
MKTLSFADATATQMATFAASYLGIDAEARMGKEKIIAKMRAAGYLKDIIEVEEAEPTRTAAQAPAAEPAAKRGRRYVEVLVSEDDKPGGTEPVYTNHNGTTMLIPRGVPAIIPEVYLACLKDAVAYRYDPLPEGGLGPRKEIPQYSYSVLRAPFYLEDEAA